MPTDEVKRELLLRTGRPDGRGGTIIELTDTDRIRYLDYRYTTHVRVVQDSLGVRVTRCPPPSARRKL